MWLANFDLNSKIFCAAFLPKKVICIMTQLYSNSTLAHHCVIVLNFMRCETSSIDSFSALPATSRFRTELSLAVRQRESRWHKWIFTRLLYLLNANSVQFSIRLYRHANEEMCWNVSIIIFELMDRSETKPLPIYRFRLNEDPAIPLYQYKYHNKFRLVVHQWWLKRATNHSRT